LDLTAAPITHGFSGVCFRQARSLDLRGSGKRASSEMARTSGEKRAGHPVEAVAKPKATATLVAVAAQARRMLYAGSTQRS